jgi:hypothetical protein
MAVYSGIKHKTGLFLVSCLIFTNGTILSSYIGITKNIFGFGIIWPMIALAGILTLLFYKIPKNIVSNSNARDWLIPIAILVSIFYCLLFLPLYLFPLKSFKVLLSFMLSIIVGWKLLGGLLAKNPATIYKNILMILYAGTVIQVIDIVLNIIIFNETHPGFWNPIKMLLLSVNSSVRFQAITNAVGMGYGLVFIILIVLNRFVSSKSLLLRFFLLSISSYSGILLISTGSRGPIFTLFCIIVIFFLYALFLKRTRLSTKLISVMALGLIFSILIFDLSIMNYISTRGFGIPENDSSLIQIFMKSRINYVVDIVNAASQLGYNEFFGAGPGADAKIATTFSRDYPIIESFFIRLFFNWGIFGAFFYILGMVALSYQVFKMERIERARGNRHAWLATVMMLIPWISSPFSFGHGIPGAALCFTFAIGAGAFAYCKFYTPLLVKTDHQKKMWKYRINGK